MLVYRRFPENSPSHLLSTHKRTQRSCVPILTSRNETQTNWLAAHRLEVRKNLTIVENMFSTSWTSWRTVRRRVGSLVVSTGSTGGGRSTSYWGGRRV